jgi:hypothetical protein
MDDANLALIPQALAARGLPTLDLTGCAPELHARFRDLLRSDFTGATIAVADHCCGCTAGQGSSCGGALVDAGQPGMP